MTIIACLKYYTHNIIILRYSPHQIIYGSVYSGKDRHYGEVVAFYLSVVMNFSRVPVAAIRKLDIKELLLVSDRALLETFITKRTYS